MFILKNFVKQFVGVMPLLLSFLWLTLEGPAMDPNENGKRPPHERFMVAFDGRHINVQIKAILMHCSFIRFIQFRGLIASISDVRCRSPVRGNRKPIFILVSVFSIHHWRLQKRNRSISSISNIFLELQYYLKSMTSLTRKNIVDILYLSYYFQLWNQKTQLKQKQVRRK